MKYLEFSKTKPKTQKGGYIFCGEDIFFLFEGVKKVQEIYRIEADSLDCDICEDFESFFRAVESVPFFSENRLVIFQSCDFTNKTHAKMLKDYLKNPNPQTIFVLTSENKPKEKFDCEIIDCAKESEAILAKWIVAKSRQFGKVISLSLASEVAKNLSCDMARIAKETEKLAFYCETGTITKEDVEACTPKDPEKIIFRLTDAISKKDGARARKLLLEMKEDLTIFQVQGLLYKTFQRMFFIKTQKKSNSEIASVLGVKEYAVKVLADSANKFSVLKLKLAVEYLQACDYKIKSGEISQQNLIEDTLLYLIS